MTQSDRNPLPTRWDTWKYHIGAPVWTCKNWNGTIYPQKSNAKDSLHWYSHSFNTVEGNSTFYALPPLETVHRWVKQTPTGFRFAMKFPREISHDAKLDRCRPSLDRFLDLLKTLQDGDRLGPSFLQLGPDFSSLYWEQLRSFVESFPKSFPIAIEFRHPDWFDKDRWEDQANQLLELHHADRVHLDSRALNSRVALDETEAKAQKQKPRSPMRTTVTGTNPFLRLIGLNDPNQVDPWWDEWAGYIAGWIQEGRTPWVFTHAPDDQFAPTLARRLHDKVRAILSDLPSLPVAPAANPSSKPIQPTLFD